MDLSVVIPLYNEEDCVASLVDELLPVLAAMDADAEVILVDDGSTDATAARIRDAVHAHPDIIRHISVEPNRGQTAALWIGFRAARGRYIAMLDGDLQVDPRDLVPMMDLIGEVDLVHGWRRDRHDTRFKRLQTRIANGVRNRVLNSPGVHDTGCPIKLMRREVAACLPPCNGMHRFIINLARMNGFTTREIVVRHRPRAAGRSKYGMWNRVFRATRDLFGVRWMASRAFPLDAVEVPATTKTPSHESATSNLGG